MTLSFPTRRSSALPDGIMALVLPTEARDMPGIWSWLEKMVAGNGPIRKLVPVDVRQSMANGGGPACLRLRVVADPAHIDPRFLVDERSAEHTSELQSLMRISYAVFCLKKTK